MENKNLLNYSPLTLAYLGDAVFELMVREYVVSKGNMQAKKLHNISTMYVKATAQAKAYDDLFNDLTEEEQNILKRGKNAKPHSFPKSSTILEYKKATGLEALFGYLYLKGETKRLAEIFKKTIDLILSEGIITKQHENFRN